MIDYVQAITIATLLSCDYILRIQEAHTTTSFTNLQLSVEIPM